MTAIVSTINFDLLTPNSFSDNGCVTNADMKRKKQKLITIERATASSEITSLLFLGSTL